MIAAGRIPFFVVALISAASCLELKIELDADSTSFPHWVSGTIKVKNNEARTRVVSMEESQTELFISQDSSVKLSKVTDFGPDSTVSLEPGVSAMWCFMAGFPENYAKSKPKGFHKISLTMRQFEAVATSRPFILWIPGALLEKDLSLASMRNLRYQLDKFEVTELDEATRRISFSGKPEGIVDPRIVFWKYRLRRAPYVKDLRQVPVCENCFRMPATLYWSNLLSDWCGMFYWESPRCAENEARLQAMWVSRLGMLDGTPTYANRNRIVNTPTGKFVVSRRQMKILARGGSQK